MRYNNIQELFEGIESANVQKKVFAQLNETKYTYKQLLQDSNKLCHFFHSKGLQKGDRILLSTSDDYYTVLFFLSFLRYGLVTILLDPEVPVHRANALIEKSEAKGFVMDEDVSSKRNITASGDQFELKIAKEKQKKGRLFNRLLKSKKQESSTSTNTFPAILETIPEYPNTALISVESSDLAYILFTSGTTAEPKGVMITHGNLLAQLHTLSKVYEMNEESHLHNILPLYHVDGIIQGPLLTLYNHATWLRPLQFDLSKLNTLFHSFYKQRASHFFCVPLMLSFMDKYAEGYEDSFQTEDFKYVISSASKLEKKLWEDFERKFKVPIVNVYGMTETVAAAMYCAMNDFPRKIGTVGIPIDCEAKVIKPDGNEAKVNEPGVLWLKGTNISSGYFNDDAASKEVLKDGWLNTGDVATKDDNGFYEITGRVKNMIISGGVNIYPEQVSEMINSHSAVLESICLGISDENYGEKLVSAVVSKPGSNLDKLELLSFLRPLLKQNQLPKEIYFLKELPKGLTGKTLVSEVEKLIIKTNNNPSEVTSETEYDHSIKEAASEAFGIAADNLTMEDTAQTIEGWDSMAHLVFVTSLEKQFKVRFSTSEMMTMTSLKSAHRILNQKLNSK